MEPETNVGETGALETSSEHSTTALTVEAIRQALVPEIEQVVVQHVNTSVANLYRGIQGVLDGTVKQIADTLGVDRETALAMKEAAKAQLGDEAYGEISRRATQESEAAKLRRELDELKAASRAPADPRTQAQQEWSNIHQPELMEYTRELDVDFAEVYKGMKGKTIESYPDRFLGWKREFRKLANKLADDKRRDGEDKKVVLDTTRGAAAPRKDYSTANIRDIPDAEFTSNFADIVAATVAKNRR